MLEFGNYYKNVHLFIWLIGQHITMLEKDTTLASSKDSYHIWLLVYFCP